jgi:hypothetical protein
MAPATMLDTAHENVYWKNLVVMEKIDRRQKNMPKVW